jgi:site-specific DNA recombinase
MTTKQRSKSKAPTALPTVVAAIYVRVSTEEQAKEGYGLDAQLTRTQAQAVVKGWEVTPEHLYRDEGISGTLPPEERPGLAALLAAVTAGEVTAVIVLGLDRLGRKAKLVLDIVDQITDAGTELVSCKESLDTTTPAGRFVLTIFAALAQLERDNIVERTTSGRDERGKKDGEKGGRLPYGYKRTAAGIRIDQTLAPIVRRIVRDDKRGLSQTRIAAALNDAGIVGPRGGRWYASSVDEILKNRPAYRGGKRGESAARWPAILS